LAKETKIGDKNKYLKKGGHVTIGLMILAKIREFAVRRH
jgi:hypothetical protein